jgi:hypothetical protein
VRANYAGTCRACGEPIAVGATVLHRLGQWVHRRCADSTVTVMSDRCGVPTVTGAPCRNPVLPGDRCPVHRWDGAA